MREDSEHGGFDRYKYICCFDESGELLRAIPLGDMGLPEDIYDTYFFTMDGKGLAYATMFVDNQLKLCCIDVTDAPRQLFTLDIPSSGVKMVPGADGTMFVLEDTRTGSRVRAVDAEGRGWVESWEFDERFDELYTGDEDFELYLQGGSVVYGLSLADGSLTEIFDHLECGLQFCNQLSALGDGRFLVMGSDRRGFALYLLTPYEGESRTITLAVTGNSISELRRGAAEWNRQHGELRVEIIDFSIYNTDSSPEGTLRLTKEIVSGNYPDMLELTDQPVERMAAKGLLEDLYPYIDADGELSRADLFPNVLKALETGGELCELAPLFRVETVVGKSELVGDEPGWSFEDMQRAFDRSGAKKCFSPIVERLDFLRWATDMTMYYLMDWDAGRCDFDSQLFIDILKTAAKQPETVQNYEVVDGMPYILYFEPDKLRSGEQLLSDMGIGHFDAVADSSVKFFGPDYTFIGFPTDEGSGSAVRPAFSVGISAFSKNKDECWEFLRFLLSDYYYRDRDYSTFPLAISGYESWQAMYEYDVQRGEEWLREDVELPVMLKRCRDLVESADVPYRHDETAWNIIADEAAAYFAGGKSAEEAAAAIQSRASLYMAEQR